VTAYDRRGLGRSDQPFDGYDDDSFADDLADIMEAAEVEDALLVGFSRGGGEVARYLSRHEKAGVSKVALISSVVPFKQQTADNPGGAPAKVFEDMKAGICNDSAGFMQRFAPRVFGNGGIARAVSDGVLATHKDQMARDLLAFIDEV
jgi:pimeloyl-ACP methyl ester carboxylesterase